MVDGGIHTWLSRFLFGEPLEVPPGFTLKDGKLFDDQGRERGYFCGRDIHWKPRFTADEVRSYNHDDPDPYDDALIDLASECFHDPTKHWDRPRDEILNERWEKRKRQKAGVQSSDKF